MVAVSRTNQMPVNLFNPAALSRIVGIACVAGFCLDMLVVSMPFVPGALEWRLNFLQQMGERSIVLLFGIALILLSNTNNRLWSKRVSFIALIAGVVFLLSCLLSLRDTLTLQKVSIEQIDDQAAQLQTRIDQERQNNPEFTAQVTPEQIEQAFQQVNSQAEAAKQNVKTGTVRSGMATMSNLVVIGIALVSLGRYGMKARRG